LITGLFARFGALALFGLLAVLSLVFHDFWTLSGFEAQLQLTQFLKNLAIMGGLLCIVVTGPGNLSLGTGKYTRV
jgi:putative oxidoreductase